MRKRLLTSLITLFILNVSVADAAPDKKFSTLGTYFGFAQGWAEIEENNLNTNFEMYTFDFIGGMNFHENMGLEGRLGFGGNDSSGSRKFSLDHYLSLYLKPQYSFGRLNAYALVGPSFVSSETAQTVCSPFCLEVRNDYSEFSLSYGVGVLYHFDMIMVGLEYVKVLDKDRIDIERSGLLFGFMF